MAESKVENLTVKVDIGSTAPVAKEEPKAIKKKGPDKGGFYWGTGRRKSSVARVRLKAGDGKLMINKRELNVFFPLEQDQKAVLAALKAVGAEKTLDVYVNVRGGGTTGQAGATMLGIARALKTYDEGLLPALRDGGYLTRDSRMVERKKPGQRGARRRFQFSKR